MESTFSLPPMLFPEYACAGLVCGTVIFSVAAGCCKVLLSPVVAALPSDDPGRDMSCLHSLYGYGVLLVVGLAVSPVVAPKASMLMAAAFLTAGFTALTLWRKVRDWK